MTHLYSRGCEYALRALRAMVEQPRGGITISALCARAGIPEHFTRKMLQPLVRAGILRSSRGPGGGFAFGRPPAEISLLDVISVIESEARYDHCLLGSGPCDCDDPCPLHGSWEPIRRQVRRLLQERTIADLAAPAANPDVGVVDLTT